MNKDAKPARWFSAWRNTRRAPVGDDPADVGTAFGLDLSMETEVPAPPQPTTALRQGWMRRLTGRRRPAS